MLTCLLAQVDIATLKLRYNRVCDTFDPPAVRHPRHRRIEQRSPPTSPEPPQSGVDVDTPQGDVKGSHEGGAECLAKQPSSGAAPTGRFACDIWIVHQCLVDRAISTRTEGKRDFRDGGGIDRDDASSSLPSVLSAKSKGARTRQTIVLSPPRARLPRQRRTQWSSSGMRAPIPQRPARH